LQGLFLKGEFMARKYHVFISSTTDDLKNERHALNRLVWELGHIPVCLDTFDISNEEDQRMIKRIIGECDYFLSLAASHYGPQSDGVAGTEIEYTPAAKEGIPVIGLLISEKARWKKSKQDADPALISSMEEFKRRLQAHPHILWNNVVDLKQKAREVLTQEMFLNPRNGWTVGDLLPGPSAANVMGRLITENEEMKRQLLIRGSNVAQWQAKMKHTLGILAGNKITLSFYYSPGDNWENTIKCRYLRLFQLLVPELYLAKTTSELSRFLGNILNPDLSRTVRKDYPTPSNTIKKIMTDFNLLKLVHYSDGANDEVWELSGYGKELYALYRMGQIERGLKNAAIPPSILPPGESAGDPDGESSGLPDGLLEEAESSQTALPPSEA
jgi:hypothetical protein